jgi:hypothetical protein
MDTLVCTSVASIGRAGGSGNGTFGLRLAALALDLSTIFDTLRRLAYDGPARRTPTERSSCSGVSF